MDNYRKEYKDKKVIITGGAGCVGTNLTRALIEAEAAKIIVLDDLSAAARWNIPTNPSVQFIEGSHHIDTLLVGQVVDGHAVIPVLDLCEAVKLSVIINRSLRVLLAPVGPLLPGTVGGSEIHLPRRSAQP